MRDSTVGDDGWKTQGGVSKECRDSRQGYSHQGAVRRSRGVGGDTLSTKYQKYVNESSRIQTENKPLQACMSATVLAGLCNRGKNRSPPLSAAVEKP